MGDDSKTPRYIVGVRGRGYRLIATVSDLHIPAQYLELLQSPQSQPSQPIIVPAAHVASRPRWRMAVVGSGVLLALAATVVQLNRRTTERAATLVYAAAASNTLSVVSETVGSGAIRIAARNNGQLARAAAYFTQRGAIRWDESGNLIQGDVTSVQINAVGLADMLVQMGETARARQLLEASLAAMDRDEREYQRGEIWYFMMRSVALALLGRDDEAIAVLQRKFIENSGSEDVWYVFELEPAFAALRKDSRFAAMHTQRQAHLRA